MHPQGNLQIHSELLVSVTRLGNLPLFLYFAVYNCENGISRQSSLVLVKNIFLTFCKFACMTAHQVFVVPLGLPTI